MAVNTPPENSSENTPELNSPYQPEVHQPTQETPANNVADQRQPQEFHTTEASQHLTQTAQHQQSQDVVPQAPTISEHHGSVAANGPHQVQGYYATPQQQQVQQPQQFQPAYDGAGYQEPQQNQQFQPAYGAPNGAQQGQPVVNVYTTAQPMMGAPYFKPKDKHCCLPTLVLPGRFWRSPLLLGEVWDRYPHGSS